MVASEQRLFFVVGRGRSGTTLLSRMLTHNPALQVAPEGFFVMNLRRRYGRGAFDGDRIRAFCRDLVRENRMATWGLDLADVEARLRRRLPDLTFALACGEVYFSYAQQTTGRAAVSWVGDKNPHYGLFADRLAALFPAARFVHIVRDPRDNVLSYQKVPFDLSDTAALAYRWRRYNRELLRAAAAHPGRFLRLRYEDLVREPEPSLRAVCDFLGVAFAPAMLSFFEHKPRGFYGQGSAWFDNLAKPVDAGQAHKWRAAMPAGDRAVVERICGADMAGFGYEASEAGAALSPRARVGAAVGWGSVTAEKAIFGGLPPEFRIWLINTYRARTGRI